MLNVHLPTVQCLPGEFDAPSRNGGIGAPDFGHQNVKLELKR